MGVCQNRFALLDRRGDHLMRTPMHTRFVPDAYDLSLSLSLYIYIYIHIYTYIMNSIYIYMYVYRRMPRCSDHVYGAGIFRRRPIYTDDDRK